MTKFAFGLLSLLMVYFLSTIETAAADSWEEDFRRCLVRKGAVVISADEKMVQLIWIDGFNLDEIDAANVSIRIDHGPVLHPKPLRSDVGMLYDFELGSFDAIFPALSRGKQLQISIPDKPESSVNLDIGAGGKAVTFLKKCNRYWTNLHTAINAWERGRASAKAGEYTGAIKDFDQAIQKLPTEYITKRARILFERGQAKLGKGDKTGGNADIRAATKLRRSIATMDNINP
jgi:hypothetical protein